MENGPCSLATTDQLIFDVVEEVRQNNYGAFHVAGIVLLDKDFRGGTIQGIPVVADASDAADYAAGSGWMKYLSACRRMKNILQDW